MKNIISEKRKELGLTMKDLSKMVNVSEATISRWESGNIANMRRDKISLLANALKISPTDLINGNDNFSCSSGVKIPVLGFIRAGLPLTATENIIDYEEISEEMARNGEYFGLKIKGDSMSPRFVEGDVVIVRKQETVDNGEIAIIMVNSDEATVKKFYKTATGVQLIATNPNYPAMTFTPEQVNNLPVTIAGKVVELRAKF